MFSFIFVHLNSIIVVNFEKLLVPGAFIGTNFGEKNEDWAVGYKLIKKRFVIQMTHISVIDCCLVRFEGSRTQYSPITPPLLTNKNFFIKI